MTRSLLAQPDSIGRYPLKARLTRYWTGLKTGLSELYKSKTACLGALCWWCSRSPVWRRPILIDIARSNKTIARSCKRQVPHIILARIATGETFGLACCGAGAASWG